MRWILECLKYIFLSDLSLDQLCGVSSVDKGVGAYFTPSHTQPPPRPQAYESRTKPSRVRMSSPRDRSGELTSRVRTCVLSLPVALVA